MTTTEEARSLKVLYTAVATADGGRAGGHVRSTDGNLDLPVSPPKELGGEGAGTNPEQLFAAGYAACFHSAVQIIARRMDQDASESTVTAHVDFGTIGGGRFGLAVELHVHLPNVSDPQAREEIAEKSHKVCPYSNATRGNIDVKLVVPAEA
jgi:lipoyl-dependent peroxiredoxin